MLKLVAKTFFNTLKWGVLCSSFFVVACSSDPVELTIKEECDTCLLHESVEFESSELKIKDSLVLETTEELGQINPDIPPKKIDKELYLLTTKNYLLKYKIDKHNSSIYQIVCKFPEVYSMVSDYLILNDSIVVFCCNDGTNSIARYNFSNTSCTKRTKTDTTICNSMPFLGLSLRKVNDTFLFPLVKMKHVNEESNFLSVYNENLEHTYAIGNFRTYNKTNLAPYFDSPIMTELVDDFFYITSSSSNGVLKCKLELKNDEIEVIQQNRICLSKQLFNKMNGKLKGDDLGDFRILESAYIADQYTIGLHYCKNQLIRIVKGKQPVINPKTKRKNIAMNAPWSLEIYDLLKKKGKIHRVSANLFRFTNSLVVDNQLFILSNHSTSTKTIFYAVN